MRNIKYLSLGIIFFIITSCAKKEIYYFNTISPPSVLTDDVNQVSTGIPPLYRPQGKRVTIRPLSQFFTLAIPNSKDMTGRAEDLQKSLADMLYTQLFKTRRFNLYDRDELKNIDADWLENSLKETLAGSTEMGDQIKERKESESKTDAIQDSELIKEYVKQSFNVMDKKKQISENLVNDLRNHSDGMLMTYITSRTKHKSGGTFSLDYRIVSSSPDNRVVLFAASKQIKYKVSSNKEVAYNRDDITAIAEEINRVFPNPNVVRKGQIVSVSRSKAGKDGQNYEYRIVMDIGKQHYLIPGMRGYVVARDDSVRTSDDTITQHYAYLSLFQIVEVYPSTSTGKIIFQRSKKSDTPPEGFPDIKVGDEVILK